MGMQLDVALVLFVFALDEGFHPLGVLDECQGQTAWVPPAGVRLLVGGFVLICFLRLGFYLCRTAYTVASSRRAVRIAAIEANHDYTMVPPSDGGQVTTIVGKRSTLIQHQTRARVREDVAARRAAREAEAAATRVCERAGQRAQQVKRTWLARKFGGLKSDALRMLLVSLQLTAVAQLWPSDGMACASSAPLTASQTVYGATSHTDEAAPSYSVQIDGLSDGETQLLLQEYETSNVLMQLLVQSPSALSVSPPPPPSAAASLSALLPSPLPPSPPSPPRHVQSAHLGDDSRTRPPELREVGPQRLEPPCQRAYAPSFRLEFRPRTPKWSRFPHVAFSPPPPLT